MTRIHTTPLFRLSELAGIDVARSSRVKLLEVCADLQQSAQPAGGDSQGRWANQVAVGLAEARQAVAVHRREMVGKRGLREAIRFEAQWLLPRMQEFLHLHRRIESEAGALATEIERIGKDKSRALDAARTDLRRIVGLLRDLLATEHDLVFAQFDEPPALD